MFIIRCVVPSTAPPAHVVVLRNAADGWAVDHDGVFHGDAWVFEIDEANYAPELEFKFVLDRTVWMDGYNLTVALVAGGVAEYKDDAIHFPGFHPTGQDRPVQASPLIAFDPAGQPTRISYQVAEPMSYRGRHALALDYALADFGDVLVGVDPPAPGQVPPVPPAPIAGAMADVAEAATSDPRSALIVPRSVLINTDSSDDSRPVILLAPYPLSDQLAALKWSQVTAALNAGKRIDVYRSLGGQLDYRVRDVTAAASGALSHKSSALSSASIGRSAVLPAATASAVSPYLTTQRADGREPADPPTRPYQYVDISSPDPNHPALTGPWNGLQLLVKGTWEGVKVGQASIVVEVDGANPQIATRTESDWSAAVSLTASGTHVITAISRAIGVADRRDEVTVAVTLDSPLQTPPPPPPPPPAPLVTITTPKTKAQIVAPNGSTIVAITGAADTHGGAPVTVSVAVVGNPEAASEPTLKAVAGSATAFTWETSVLLPGTGSYVVTANARNTDGLAAPTVSITVTVVQQQPRRAIDRRLILVETVAISSFLGSFGAGRVVKTFTLLPGEQTEISIETYNKSETTAKQAASILDSAASETAGDFENTISDEQDHKADSASQQNRAISVDVGAGWGWGHADIKGSYSDSANASRSEMAKNVLQATQKHSNKASTNRNVQVNTDFTSVSQVGVADDTKRTLKNINVSRVLNFVFRQMTQEHVVLVHLVDVAVGYYTLDVLLGPDGNPQTGHDGPIVQESYQEYSLSELDAFQRKHMTGGAAKSLRDDIISILSNVSDYRGDRVALAEVFTPTIDGQPRSDLQYARVKPRLHDTFVSDGGDSIAVPGIILDHEAVVMRTDAVLVDAVLGEGNALDDYSRSLQQVTIDERRVALAREELAQRIVSSKDGAMADLWDHVFPPPPSPILGAVPVEPVDIRSAPQVPGQVKASH